MPPEPYYEACKITLTDTDNTVLLSGIDAQVKARGNWTTTYDKKALKIKFTQKQNMLGLNDGAQMKNWLLLAEYKDASMLRNKTALSIASEILEKDG
jgi:spore coat protein CotH